MADLAVWQRTIVDEEGNVIPGAEIEVRREEDDSLATLYADRAGETPLANPLAADMSGFVRFFAQGDAYTITAVGAGSTRTWRFDPTGRLQEFDRISEALVADDAADLVAARSNLGTFSTVADVQNSHIPAVLESIRTFGRNAPGDGPPLDLVRGAEVPGAVQSADGQWWEDVGYNTITVRIPSQFPTLQAAIDHYSRLPMRQGAIIDLLIESGHQPASGISVSNGDYGKFRVSSEDAEVSVADDYSGRFVEADYAIAPALNCLVDARNRGGTGYWCNNSSQGQVNLGCGVKNVEGRAGLYANSGSVIAAGGSIFTGAASRGAWASRGGIISCAGTDFSGARSDPDDHDEAVVYVSRTGMIDATQVIAHGVTTRRIFGAKRTGLINAHGCDVSGSTLMAVESRRAGVILVNDGVFTDIGGQGLVADGPGAVVEASGVTLVGATGNSSLATRSIRGGSIRFNGGDITAFGRGLSAEYTGTINAQDCTVDGVAGNGASAYDGGVIALRNASVINSGSYDLVVLRGGQIFAHDATTTNGSGSPALGDTNVYAFNQEVSGGGTIYSSGENPSAIVASSGDDSEGYWRRGDGWTECWSTVTFDSDVTTTQNFPMPVGFRDQYGIHVGFTTTTSSADDTATLNNTFVSVTTASRWTVRRVGGSGNGNITLRLYACGYAS